jgi:hypothetical protein
VILMTDRECQYGLRLVAAAGPPAPPGPRAELRQAALPGLFFSAGFAMPTKHTPVEPKLTYAEWRARCAALLERQGLSPDVMRERDWRKMYIGGATRTGRRPGAGSLLDTCSFERLRPKR